MADNIDVDPGTGGSKVPVATRTLTVNATPGVEVPYGILGTESAGALVPVDSTHGLPVSLLNSSIAVTGTFYQSTQPVSAASLPLPTGAATAANQATELGYLATIAAGAVTANAGTNLNTSTLALETGGNLATIAGKDFATQTTLAALNAKVTAVNTGAVVLAAGSAVIGHVIVDTAPTTAVTGTFWQATQPVSGTVTANAGTGTLAVSAASLPLPTGASTESTLSTLNGKVTACDTGAVTVSAALPAGSNVIGHVIVDTAPSTAVTGTFWQATQPVSIATAPALVASTATIGYVNAIQAGDTIEIAGTTYTVKRAFANATASGETTVVAAVSAKKIRVLSYSIGPVSAAVNVYFDNATDGAATSTKYLAANGGMGRALNHFGHFQTGTVNEALRINLSGNANVGVDVLYIEV